MDREFVIGGNWKLQVTTRDDAEKRIRELDEALEKYPGLEVFIAIPSIFLYTLQTKNIKLAAEDIHYKEKGAYTGATSIQSLLDAGIKYTLVGHSERRIIFRETDEEVNQKVLLALAHNITPVLCIGETAKEREEGRYEEVLSNQIRQGLRGVVDVTKVMVAYEPVWAIDNKDLNPDSEIRAATPEDAENTHLFIRNLIANLYDKKSSEKVTILYGGSMKAANAKELLLQKDIDGGLIGGASLSVETLEPVFKIATTIK